MKNVFICLVVIAGLTFLSVTNALADTKATVNASVVLTGTPFVEVTNPNITWSNVILGTTTWKAANTLLEVKYLLPAGGAITICTNNANNPATPVDESTLVGLVGANDGGALPACWRIFNTSGEATPAELTIYEWVYHIGADWISKLTNQSTQPVYEGPNDPDNTAYSCWLWMKDGPFAGVPEEYVQIVNSTKGLQHGEATWGTWNGSPDYVSVGANFSKATPQTYSANIELQVYQP